MEYFILSNGVKMPKLGLGSSHSGGYSHEAVVYALKDVGYRLIDTAKRYGNEELIQKAIARSECHRRDLFLTSKLWPTDYGNINVVRPAFEGSSKRLGTDYLDLYLLHWPLLPHGNTNVRPVLKEAWRALEILHDEGLCRSIGVCNFTEEELSDLIEDASVIPHVQQSEFHVQHNSESLQKFCSENRIQYEGYCPLGKGTLVGVPEIIRFAKLYNRTPAQVLIRWSIQHNVVTIPKSTNLHRLKENFNVFDFELSISDMALIDSLNTDHSFVSRATVQRKLDLNLPDGYRLNRTSGA